MTTCKYLTGENISPKTVKEARALIGTRVIYLQAGDIDHSGRGYFFPRYGTIAAVEGRAIAIDNPHDFCVTIAGLVEMVAA